jgi:hypothetical protein
MAEEAKAPIGSDQDIVEDILHLYRGDVAAKYFKNYRYHLLCALMKIFSDVREDAVFEDSLGKCEGIDGVKATFVGLKKLFNSEIKLEKTERGKETKYSSPY